MFTKIYLLLIIIHHYINIVLFKMLGFSMLNCCLLQTFSSCKENERNLKAYKISFTSITHMYIVTSLYNDN